MLHVHHKPDVSVAPMKRLQIMIPEDLDAALQRQADREGVSKAAVVRRIVRAELPPAGPLSAAR